MCTTVLRFAIEGFAGSWAFPNDPDLVLRYKLGGVFEDGRHRSKRPG